MTENTHTHTHTHTHTQTHTHTHTEVRSIFLYSSELWRGVGPESFHRNGRIKIGKGRGYH